MIPAGSIGSAGALGQRGAVAEEVVERDPLRRRARSASSAGAPLLSSVTAIHFSCRRVLGDERGVLRLGDGGDAAGVAGEVLDLGADAAGVGRDRDGAEQRAGVPGRAPSRGSCRRGSGPCRPCATPRSARPGGERAGLVEELGVGPGAVVAVRAPRSGTGGRACARPSGAAARGCPGRSSGRRRRSPGRTWVRSRGLLRTPGGGDADASRRTLAGACSAPADQVPTTPRDDSALERPLANRFVCVSVHPPPVRWMPAHSPLLPGALPLRASPRTHVSACIPTSTPPSGASTGSSRGASSPPPD